MTVNSKPAEWEDIFEYLFLTAPTYSQDCLQIIKTKKPQEREGQKKQALRKDLHVPDNKHMPGCSTSLAIEKMQIKTQPKTAKLGKAQSCLVLVNELEHSYVAGRAVNSKW